MAVIYADNTGALTRIERAPGELGGAPPNTADQLSFDPSTNPGLAQDVVANMAAYNLTGTTLRKDGAPVTIAAPSQDFNDGAAFAAILAALAAGTASNAQVQQVCRYMLRHGRTAGIW